MIKDLKNAAAASRILSRRFKDLNTQFEIIQETYAAAEGVDESEDKDDAMGQSQDAIDEVATLFGEIEERYTELKAFCAEELGLEE